jgi:hypothetical protein
MTKLMRFIMPIFIAVVLGPLIAGLALYLLAISNTLDHTVSLPVADLFSMLGVCIVIAYFSGGVVALAAGILVSIWMLWRPPSAIVVMAAAGIATAGYLGVGALGFLSLAQYGDVRGNFLFALALAVIAAAGCWLLTSRFVRTL